MWLAYEGHHQRLVALAAIAYGFSRERFSGEDFVSTPTVEMNFSLEPFERFDFGLEDIDLHKRQPFGHAVAPAEGILAIFAGEAPLEDIGRGEGSPGLIVFTNDIPL